MEFGSQGENLIFLISQPRAGSTLLQRILGGHPDIYTVSEPWLMLHPLYALRFSGVKAEYNAHLAGNALQDFLQILPNGKADFFEGVRRMYGYLYKRALENAGKCYFLDKTPRYYFIIPELYHTFPKAHYIILFRNPLAVLCSILNTWINKNWFSLYSYKHDLILSPRLLIEGKKILGENCIVVHYEQLISNPEIEIERICKKLGIVFSAEMIEYRDRLPQWHLGDKEIYQYSQPHSLSREKWVKDLQHPQIWRLVDGYLKLLGKEIISQMGYKYDELQRMLYNKQPNKIRLSVTMPLSLLLKKYMILPRGIIWLKNSIKDFGLRETINILTQKLSL